MNLHQQVESVILSNLCHKPGCKVGVEVEYLLFNRHGQRIPVNAGPSYSATDIMNELSCWQKAVCQDINYSLEPGGQIEFASRPFKSLHEVQSQHDLHLGRLRAIAQQEKLWLLDYSLDPLHLPDTVELIVHPKYAAMDQRFRQTGNRGQWMMRNTASVQVNIDITSRTVAEEMAFIADCLSPVASALFANSPFMNGQPTAAENPRAVIWDNTDPARCGELLDQGITSPDGLLDKYINWLLSVPLIFATDEAGAIIPYSGTGEEWLTDIGGNHSITPQQIQAVLHQIFTNVRFKHVVEIRGADRPPIGYELAPAAFWMGLLTARATREKLLPILRSWSMDYRQRLHRLSSALDLTGEIVSGQCLGDLIDKIATIALTGLDQRAADCRLESERPILENYLKFYRDKSLPAVDTVRRFRATGKPLDKFLLTEMERCTYP